MNRPTELTLPPKKRTLDENRDRLFSSMKKSDVDFVVKKEMPLTHVTTTERVRGILESGELRSMAKLEARNSAGCRISANTDELDRKHGFDKYVFTTLGRCATQNEGEIMFAFPASEILPKEGVLFSFKEIADYGALVSPEAEAVFRARTGKSPKARNAKAVGEFFRNVVRGSDAPRLMSSFLIAHYNEYVDYLLSLTYPGEKLEIIPELGVHNVWGGPQCMVPDALSLDSCAYVLTPDVEIKAYVEEIMRGTGRDIPVRSIPECS